MGQMNLRSFLDRVKKGEKFGKISPLNTLKSVTFDFSKYDESMKPYNFPDDGELVYYIQDITLPSIAITAGDSINSPFQTTSTIKSIYGTASTFDISFLNTINPIQETCFLDWLNQTRSTLWYGAIPYPIADVTISFKEKVMQYKLYGCRPTSIELAQPTQKSEASLVRKVTFNVDFIHAFLEEDSLLQSTDAGTPFNMPNRKELIKNG